METAKHKREFSFSKVYEAPLRRELAALGYDLDEPVKLAQAVKQLSDFYLAHPLASTPWSEPWARAASLAYYFPLNYARNAAVALEAKRLGFFDDLNRIEDVGCGMGSGLLAFVDAHGFSDAHGTDLSTESLKLCAALDAGRSSLQLKPGNTETQTLDPKSLLLASFVLTELSDLPRAWMQAEAIAIIEPSTHTDARRLQSYRGLLMSEGFDLWAPCTHHGDCPLLIRSERDWCHDRIHWLAPEWFEKMEQRLPMKNRTLTFSYLLARKRKRPNSLGEYGRLVGDTLIEKGKSRQAFCRNDEREFLAWFPQRLRAGESIELQRGNLVALDNGLQKKANEIRLPSSEKIRELPPATPLSK